MKRLLLILVLPLLLSGCITEQKQPQPMSLGLANEGQQAKGAGCLRYGGDSAAFDDCKGPSAVTISQGR